MNICASRITSTFLQRSRRPLNTRMQVVDTLHRHTQNVVNRLSRQNFCTYAINEKLVTCELRSRGVIEVKGSDSTQLLQGLITNDIRNIQSTSGATQYSLMLNVKGRIMYDVFIHNASEGDNSDRFLIDCDVGIVQQLIDFFSRYKIRKKVEIKYLDKDLTVSVVIPKKVDDRMIEPLGIDVTLPTILNLDPRVEEFAYRLIHSSSQGILQDVPVLPESAYTQRRYSWGIAEGVVDLPSGNCLPLESNIVLVNGASFDKGCYLGQELTARTKYTGVVRKRLMPLLFDSEPSQIEAGVAMTTGNDKNAGKYRHNVGRYGLGLVRLSEVNSGRLCVACRDGEVATAEVILPHWWPRECVEAIEQNRCCGAAT